MKHFQFYNLEWIFLSDRANLRFFFLKKWQIHGKLKITGTYDR